MSLQVVSFTTYLTDTDGVAWRRDDYNARDFVLTIKDRDIREYAFVRCRGQRRRFENSTREEVVGWFGEMVAEYCQEHPIDMPFVLVPVPGSKADTRFANVQRTTTLAEAIAGALRPAPLVLDVLRWDSPIVSSRLLAGTRDVAALYARLVLTGSVFGQRVVLVDDVVTLGGHLRACAAKLRNAGADVVLGVCVARADPIPASDPFAVRCETLPDFVP